MPVAITYATWDDVVEAYELTLPVSRKAWVETQLRRGSARLRQLVPTLDARLALPAADPARLDPELPAGLLVDAVLRVVRNPTGAQQQTAGPFNQAFAGGVQRADVHFNEAEVHQLLDPPSDPAAGTFHVAIPVQYRSGWPRPYDNDPSWLPRA